MKFRKNWKRFWTLDRHHAEGFTLVELIVVIAILAILAGVGTVGYSGYVKKANMTADQTLVSEVANALTLYYYDGNMDGSGYVILYSDGTPADADEFGTAAMRAAYGENWAETAVLKYDSWGTGSMTSVALSQGIAAANVGTSSYLTGSTPEKLLTDVSGLTYAATGLISSMTPSVKYDTIKASLFGGSEDKLNETCAKYGITTTKNSSGNTVFSDDVTDAQLSNLLVFAAAQQIANGEEENAVTKLVNDYAAYTAFVNANPDNEAAQTAYATLNESLAKGNVNSAFETFKTNASIQSDLEAYMNVTSADAQYVTDMTAFLCIMEAVSQASADVTPEEIKSGDFFASEKVSSYFDTYISAANIVGKMTEEQLAVLGDAITGGGIVVFLYSGPFIDCTADDALI